jgi:hypothetical protein
MWWKLTLVGLVTIILVVVVQPIRTHAVKIDIPLTGEVPRVPRPSVVDLFSSMYVTPTSLLIGAIIIGIATYLAFRIIRG